MKDDVTNQINRIYLDLSRNIKDLTVIRENLYKECLKLMDLQKDIVSLQEKIDAR